MFGFDENNRPDETQIIKAAMLLKKERNNFLRKLAAFAEMRAKEKAQGHWQLRKGQLEALYLPDWFETPNE